MAIIDKLTAFCDATSVAAAAGTTLKGSQIDLLRTTNDPGDGQPVYLIIQFVVGLDSAADGATAQFKLVSDDSASISTTTSSVHLITPAYTETQAVAGARFVSSLPTAGAVPYERYLGLLCTIAGETATVGSIDAWLSYDPMGWKAYPDGAH